MKSLLRDPSRRLTILLYIMAVHSFSVGAGLLIQVPELMALFGFQPCYENFFPAQGGVFHIVMAMGYALGAYDRVKYRCLIQFSIFVKAAATVFLLLYFLIIDRILMVLISGLGDGLFFAVLVWSFILYEKHRKKGR